MRIEKERALDPPEEGKRRERPMFGNDLAEMAEREENARMRVEKIVADDTVNAIVVTGQWSLAYNELTEERITLRSSGRHVADLTLLFERIEWNGRSIAEFILAGVDKEERKKRGTE